MRTAGSIRLGRPGFVRSEKPERFLEESGVLLDLVDAFFRVQFAHQQHMVEPMRAGAVQIVRPGIRIGGADIGIDTFFLRIQAHVVSARQVELQHTADERQRILLQKLGLDAFGFDGGPKDIQVLVAFDLVGNMVHAGVVGKAQDHRVLVPLVPALQIDIALVILVRDLHAHDIFIMFERRLHVHHAEGNMTYSHHTHFLSPQALLVTRVTTQTPARPAQLKSAGAICSCHDRPPGAACDRFLQFSNHFDFDGAGWRDPAS